MHDGFQGFGLGFHPGYGYGGKALGVGDEGGDPLYGGPGYPHPGPCLNRFGREKPFGYFAGPGFPTPEQPHFFGTVGPLASDLPAIEISEGPGEPDSSNGYGGYTGLVPYPESTFAPFTTAIGTAGSDAGVGPAVPPGPPLGPAPPTPQPQPAPPPASAPPLGMETESVVTPDGVKCLRISKVQPGALAEQAGLRVGDEIRSANDFLMHSPGNLAWIIARTAPRDVLRATVRTASNGQVRVITVPLR